MGIDFKKHLNPAQWEAVNTFHGPILVIAGAGSGKTRTVVYRLARLVDAGVAPESILLLTFTRKAAGEMLTRAGHLLGMGLHSVSGGTFHSFAYSFLRRHAAALGFADGFTIMDRPDCEDTIAQVRSELGLAKGDRSFPKKRTVLEILSKSRNKETDLADLVMEESPHLAVYIEELQSLAERYREYKREFGLMDYDDLLFRFEELLLGHPDLLDYLRARHRYIMVDEYQDTNLVQARLVKLLGGEAGNVMAVGDDAQSIYAFRGANVRNILDFPKDFPGTRIISLEQNYRSTQPILTLTNQVIARAEEKYSKNLFTERTGGPRPMLVKPLSDMSQALAAMQIVSDLARSYPLHEIAVLFRAGYQAYALEVELNKAGIEYRKFGGMKFSEAAHVKDVLSFVRLAVNPTDMPAWQRVLTMIKGVGPKTADKIARAALTGNREQVKKASARHAGLAGLMDFLDELRRGNLGPGEVLEKTMEFYRPFLAERYPDDYPRRQTGLEQLAQIAAPYADLETFAADLSLEPPEADQRAAREHALTLSTVHSAKGLEWSAVLILDLVEDRFPSKHAMFKKEDMEEERRLMYVACTRAKDRLILFSPATLYNRYRQQSEPTVISPFVKDLPEECVEVWREEYRGGLARVGSAGEPGEKDEPPRAGDALDKMLWGDGAAPSAERPRTPEVPAEKLGYCKHKIFGRGKIIAVVGGNKYRVNFPGVGLKIILGDYLQMEE